MSDPMSHTPSKRCFGILFIVDIVSVSFRCKEEALRVALAFYQTTDRRPARSVSISNNNKQSATKLSNASEQACAFPGRGENTTACCGPADSLIDLSSSYRLTCLSLPRGYCGKKVQQQRAVGSNTPEIPGPRGLPREREEMPKRNTEPCPVAHVRNRWKRKATQPSPMQRLRNDLSCRDGINGRILSSVEPISPEGYTIVVQANFLSRNCQLSIVILCFCKLPM